MVCTEDQKSGILWHTVIIVSGAVDQYNTCTIYTTLHGKCACFLVWTNTHTLPTRATYTPRMSTHTTLQHSTLPMYKSTNILSMSSSYVVSLLLGQWSQESGGNTTGRRAMSITGLSYIIVGRKSAAIWPLRPCRMLAWWCLEVGYY